MLEKYAIIAGMLLICAVSVFSMGVRSRLLLLLPVSSWALIVVTALLNPLSFKPISTETVLSIATFVSVLAISTATISFTMNAKWSEATSENNCAAIGTPKKLFLKYLGVFLVLSYTFFLIRSVSYLSAFGATAEYRMLAMGYGTESVIFKSATSAFFFGTIMRGLLMVFLALSLQYFFHGRGGWPLAIASALMAADSLITFGRFYIYLALFAFVIAGYLHGRRMINFRSIAVLVAALAAIYYLSTLRFVDGLGVDEFIRRYIIGYHIYGVFLLDHFIEGGIPYTQWYGGATFSGLIFLLTRPFDVVGLDLPTFLGSDTSAMLNTHVLLGFEGARRVTANSFYTVITDMFIDGGWLALLTFSAFLGIVYGAVIAVFDHRPTSRTFGILLFLTVIVFFSVLKNQLGQTYLVFAIIFFLFVPSSVYESDVKS